jgi:hypothetical protein
VELIFIDTGLQNKAGHNYRPRAAKGILWVGITSIAAAAGLSHPAEAPVRVIAAVPFRVVAPATLLLFLLLINFAFTVQPVRNNRIVRYMVARLRPR